MPFTKTPPLLCTASAPVEWNVTTSLPNIEYAQITLYINGVFAREYNQTGYVAFSGILFKINVQEFCKDALNSAVFELPQTANKDYTVNYFQTAADQLIKVRIEVAFFETTTGVPMQSGATEVSGDVYVCAANVQQQDRIDLAPYNPDNAGALPLSYWTQQRFGETSKELPEVSLQKGGFFVSAIRNQSINRFQIRLYDSFNSVIGIANKDIAPCTDLYDVYTVGIAPQNLVGIAWTNTLLGFDPINQNYEYLEVLFVDKTTSTIHQRFRIRVTRANCPKNAITVFWQNQLGGFESKIFENNHTKEIEVKSQIAQTPNTYSVFEPDPLLSTNPTNRGKVRRNIDAVRTFVVSTPIYSNKKLGWVLASLQMAARVYITEYDIEEQLTETWQPRLVPVIVRDASFVYASGSARPNSFQLTFELAHNLQILE